MYRYANLDENNKVYAISELHSEESTENLVLVDDYSVVEGYIYDPGTQTFSLPKPQLEPEQKATVEEITEETLLETKYQTFLLEMMV